MNDRQRTWGIVAALALLALTAWWWSPRGEARAKTSLPEAPQKPPATTQTVVPTVAGLPPSIANVVDAAADAPQKTLAELRLERAQKTLDGYLEGTKYPPISRPISEHPDLTTTERKVSNRLPFKKKNGTVRGDLRMQVLQSSQRLIGDEILTMTASCVSGKGFEPLQVSGAHAVEVPAKGKTPTSIAFVDDGTHGDEAANDNVWTAQFQPATSAQFNGYNGYVNVPVDVRCGGDDGSTWFDFFYTAFEPAKVTGKVREVIEQGSLALYVELDVKQAGTYKLDLRVDDANGSKLAFLSFDGVLALGVQEARFVLFGKLIHDFAAPSPFKLRDLDGYLFLSDQDPDRENLRPHAGDLFTTKKYEPSAFAGAEWSSEEKDRNVKEFKKDVSEAEQAVANEKNGTKK